MASPQSVRVSFELSLGDVTVELDQGQGPTPNQLPGAATRVDCVLTVPPNELSLGTSLRLLFKLAPAESRVLVKLLEHEHVSREAMHAAIAQDGDPATDIKGIDVTICKLRKKLSRHNIEIATIWGTGFTLGRGARDRVHKILAEHNAGLIPTRAQAPEPKPDCAP